MKLHMVAFILLVVGGLNWLAVGLLKLDIVAKIFGADSMISRIVYIVVGLAAVYEIITHKSNCKCCSVAKTSAPAQSM